MHTTIEQALETYVTELKEFRVWVDETATKYGQDAPNHWHWSDHDYQKAETWNAQLAAMRKVLALTESEDHEADQKAGIKTFP